MSDTPMDEQVIVARAIELQTQIEALYEQQDQLLEPLAKVLLSEINAWPAPVSMDVEQAMLKRIERLPQGFYRSELRTLINSKTAR